jgi:hypothetical protein
MTNPHPQKVISEAQREYAIASLQEFIALRPNAREVRKALFGKAGLSRLLI